LNGWGTTFSAERVGGSPLIFKYNPLWALNVLGESILCYPQDDDYNNGGVGGDDLDRNSNSRPRVREPFSSDPLLGLPELPEEVPRNTPPLQLLPPIEAGQSVARDENHQTTRWATATAINFSLERRS
jgi:hypothetical protein